MSWRRTPKIGDWIRPTDDEVRGIHHGYNFRLIIQVDALYEEFVTTCEAFGIEKNLWHRWNTAFVSRVVLE